MSDKWVKSKKQPDRYRLKITEEVRTYLVIPDEGGSDQHTYCYLTIFGEEDIRINIKAYDSIDEAKEKAWMDSINALKNLMGKVRRAVETQTNLK
jgi:hypothetical protein